MTEALRRSVLTRRELPKQAMLRFVVSPDGQLVPDINERLPGRGHWVENERASLQEALNKKAFSRAAKLSTLTVDDGLADKVEQLLAQKALDSLSLCRKAGLLTSGYEKVQQLCSKGKAALLILASDASENARKESASLLNNNKGMQLVDCFDRAALGEIAGRDQAVHLALTADNLTEKFLWNARRFTGFRQKDTL